MSWYAKATWLAFAWAGVLGVAYLALWDAGLAYDESGNGCRSLTSDGRKELTLRALPAQVALVAWVFAGRMVLKEGWRHVPGREGRLVTFVAVLAAAHGVAAFAVDGVVGFSFGFVVVLVGLISTVGDLVARGGGEAQRPRIPALAVACAQLLWISAAVATSLLFGGTGEILTC